MEFKLESGKKIKLKDVSIDERDEMLDSVEYQYDEKGNPNSFLGFAARFDSCWQLAALARAEL